MKMPVRDVKDAYQKAIALLPDEPRFQEELATVERRTVR